MKWALYSAIFVYNLAVNFLCQCGDNVGHIIARCVSYRKSARLQMNACFVPTAAVFPEDVGCVCTLRSLCASENCGVGTSKHSAIVF